MKPACSAKFLLLSLLILRHLIPKMLIHQECFDFLVGGLTTVHGSASGGLLLVVTVCLSLIAKRGDTYMDFVHDGLLYSVIVEILHNELSSIPLKSSIIRQFHSLDRHYSNPFHPY
jgi:hypothetical protein